MRHLFGRNRHESRKAQLVAHEFRRPYLIMEEAESLTQKVAEFGAKINEFGCFGKEIMSLKFQKMSELF